MLRASRQFGAGAGPRADSAADAAAQGTIKRAAAASRRIAIPGSVAGAAPACGLDANCGDRRQRVRPRALPGFQARAPSGPAARRI
ncbi:hypothetical protein [Lysobacter sp. CCNWLW3]|uniref:hypothetical protein n=1 Tax=Lysobacter sp. CCNWLW3 TaxID=3117014 RepID=UPI002FD09A40